MRLTRLSLIMLTAALCVAGALVGVGAQDRRPAMPAAPGNSTEPPATIIVLPDSLEPSPPGQLPVKLPAELPTHSDKMETRVPWTPPAPAPELSPGSGAPPRPGPSPAAPTPTPVAGPPAPLQLAPPPPMAARPPEPMSAPKLPSDRKDTIPPAPIAPRIADPAVPPVPSIEPEPPTKAPSLPNISPDNVPAVPPPAPLDSKAPAPSLVPVLPPAPMGTPTTASPAGPPDLPLADVPKVVAPTPETSQPLPEVPASPPAPIKISPPRVTTNVAPAPPSVVPNAAAPPPTLETSRPSDPPRVIDPAQASKATQVAIEKRGPTTLRPGVTTAYQIVLRNRGATATPALTIVDDLPAGARIIAGDPTPGQHGDQAFWLLPPLPGGGESILNYELQTASPGDFIGTTTAYVATTTTSFRAKIQGAAAAQPVSAGPLLLSVRGPTAAAVGQAVVFEVQVTNQSKQLLSELLLSAKLGDGLSHPAGNHIEADVGDLAPGATKTLKMATTASRPGRQLVEVKIAANQGAEADAKTTVTIGASAGLSLRLPPSTRLPLEGDGELRVEITNQHAETLRNVVVAGSLPEGLQFVSASHRGIHQANTRTVQWLLDSLSPGDTQQLSLKVKGKAVGRHLTEVVARADASPEVRERGVVQVESFSNLVLVVTPRDDPLEVGKETIVEVRVQNFGAAPAAGVRLQLELPPGLQPAYMQGPTAQRVQGRVLTFDPIATLPAQSQAVYHVGVAAKTAGDWRIRVQVVSDAQRAPSVREAALRVYRD